MTSQPNGAGDEHVGSLTGAYALDALDDVERARVERHLAECETCADEVRSFTETAARMAAGTAAPPPPGLREQVLAEAARTRQLPPQVDAPRWAERTARPSRGLAVAASVLLLVASGLGALAWTQYAEARQMRAVAAAMSDVLGDPDRQVVDADFASGRGTVVVADDRVLLIGHDVPSPAGGHGYQLWFIADDGARPAGMLTSVGDDRFWVDARGWQPGELVGVTVEPATGSEQPTSDPVLVAAPSS